MWTRSAKNKETGLFTVECKDWNGIVCFTGTFSTGHEADRAGEDAERAMTMRMMMPADAPTLSDIFAEMSDDDLLNELMG